MPLATSSSAMPFTSSGCRPQNSAICSKVSEVLSTSHTAVALGMSGFCSAAAMAKKSFLSPGGDPRASVPSLDRSNVEEEGGFSGGKNVWPVLFPDAARLLLRQLVPVGNALRHQPFAVDLLPQDHEIAGFGQGLGLAGEAGVEAVHADLQGAVIVDRPDFERAVHQLAAGGEVLGRLDAVAMAFEVREEFRARGLAVLVVHEAEIAGQHRGHGIAVASVEDGGEKIGVGLLDGGGHLRRLG